MQYTPIIGKVIRDFLPWQDILSFYYDNGHVISAIVDTDSGLLPGGNVTVRLQAQDGVSTSVISDNGTLAWVAFRWLETSAVPIRRAAPFALAIAFVPQTDAHTTCLQ